MREPQVGAREPLDDAGDAPGALAALLARAARGEEEAWVEIVRRYAGRLFALARSRGMSEEGSEEIAQSVLVRVAERLRDGGYEESGRFEPWLFRIAINRVRDEARRRSRQAIPTDPAALRTLENTRSDAATAGASPDRYALLRAAIETLSDADREVISLRHHAGMTFAQIAAALGQPVGTVLARHHRALRKLRDEIAGPDAHGDPL